MQLHDEAIPRPNWGGMEYAADGEWHYVVERMLYNFRLHAVRDGSLGPAHGWCYKTLPHAVAALGAWDPDTQDEPLFWHKRAGLPRRAPERDHDPDYNRPRCVHGSYLHERACDIDPFCKEFHRQGSP
jgi:hypothetical protein